MESLGLYALSVVLSYLNEIDGVALLITKKPFTEQILPIFRIPQPKGLIVIDSAPFHRYHFRVVPVHDPITLLSRLNSRRLRKRRLPVASGFTTTELAVREWSNLPELHPSCPPQLELLRFLISDRTSQFYIPCIKKRESTTLIVSYPRSGNTLVRTLLERTTGIVVGSDTRPDRSLSQELALQHDLVGEGVVTQCPFVKTHWPERTGCRTFPGHRAILLVRNPYDAIDSYWNMNATKSHTKTLSPTVYERFYDKWYGLVQNEIHIWNKFLEYWMKSVDCPVLIVRFEDLIRDPKTALVSIMKFALQQQTLSSYWMNRIHHATSAGSASTEQLGSYRPRSAARGVASIGKSLRTGHYSDELVGNIHRACEGYSENYLLRFGYDVERQGFPNNFAMSQESDMTDRILNSTNHNGAVQVNDGEPVRSFNCPYGRLLQQWRHSATNNDLEPLPTTDARA